MNRPICRKPGNFGGVVRVALALVITASCCVSNCSSCQAQSAAMMAHVTFHNRPARLIADYRTRALVKHIRPGQVASLQFSDLLHGPIDLTMSTGDPSQVAVHPGFAPTVTDRRLIARFLRALRHAYKPGGFMPAEDIPSLRITFRKSGRFRRDPLDIDFADLGPEFQSVLNDVPAYLAVQLHSKMQTLDGQVREVDFAASKVTNPQKIAQIIKALKHIKPNAFSVYGQTTDTFGLRLRLRQGGSEEVVFVIDPPLMSRSGPSVLPEPLYTDITGGKSASAP